MKTRIPWRALCAAFLFVVVASLGVLADGVILPDHPEHGWLSIVYHHVSVDVQDGVVVTHVDQLFRNDTGRDLEGRYVFPLPPGAIVSSFAMWVDGEAMEGTVLPADEARAIYEDFVRRAIDPALLEYVGRDTLSARIFPIPAGDERRIEISYTELLAADQGLHRYRYPLDTERFSARALESLKIDIRIETSAPLRAIYSPTHALSVSRANDHLATVAHQDQDVLPTSDFFLYYSVQPERMGMTLLTYRTPGEDGYFLFIATPPATTEVASIPKDIVLILDQSGSMSGEKIEQAKRALVFILQNLNPGDRFAVVAFSDVATALHASLVPASSDYVVPATAWVERLQADSGTHIDEALQLGFSFFEANDRPRFLVFLTDGEATVGETDTLVIAEHSRSANTTAARLFNFGVGYDVNTVLLDQLAQENRGTSSYVLPGENLEVVLSSFYRRIASPVLADPILEVSSVETIDVFPRVLPDLFRGSQLLILGRYCGAGESEIRLSGEVNGIRTTYSVTRPFPETELGASFLPRLWAGRRIAALLDQIRLYGESDELVDAVIKLSTTYGIITPYTSFLVDDTKAYSAEEMADAVRAATAPPTGASAVQGSAALRTLSEAETVQTGTEQVRAVEDRTYFLRDGIWVDSTHTDEETIRIAAYSEAYFDLVTHLPWIAPHLAVGEWVIVRAGTAYVQIDEEGLEELTEEIVDSLTG